MTSGLTKIDCTLCENIFGRYCVPKSSQHRPASQAALRGEVWELETINFIQRHTGDGDVIHAGMFFGDFLPGLASAVVSDRKVYGFEPNIENYIAAQWTAVLNALSNVQLFNAGLGAERKRAFMRTTSEELKALGELLTLSTTRDRVMGTASVQSVLLQLMNRCLQRPM